MVGRLSAFATLGLEPGADAASVDQAYRRLIKLHHPDREGGDAGRAAEIIRAYRELRGRAAALDPLEFNEDYALGRGGRRWPLAALVVGLAIGALLLFHGPIAPLARNLFSVAAPTLPLGHVAASAKEGDPMDEPLHASAIDAAVRDALHLSRTSDEFGLAEASRECRQRFHDDPSVARLDRCAAFDDAVVQLQDRDPLRDRGPFAQLAVTGRQWSAGSTLSDDYLAIDGRLDRIRLNVELALVPELEPPLSPPSQPAK
jgi:DnaJ-like protein